MAKIFDDIETLSLFPERGFNADEKVGHTILAGHTTRGILVANRRYHIFYQIDVETKQVNVTHLLLVKTDYGRLFE